VSESTTYIGAFEINAAQVTELSFITVAVALLMALLV